MKNYNNVFRFGAEYLEDLETFKTVDLEKVAVITVIYYYSDVDVNAFTFVACEGGMFDVEYKKTYSLSAFKEMIIDKMIEAEDDMELVVVPF